MPQDPPLDHESPPDSAEGRVGHGINCEELIDEQSVLRNNKRVIEMNNCHRFDFPELESRVPRVRKKARADLAARREAIRAAPALGSCSFSRIFLRNLGGGAKCEIWGAIWVSVAKFGHFESILHQFESHFCHFLTIFVNFGHFCSTFSPYAALAGCEIRNLGRNLGAFGAKCETKFGEAFCEKEHEPKMRQATLCSSTRYKTKG